MLGGLLQMTTVLPIGPHCGRSMTDFLSRRRRLNFALPLSSPTPALTMFFHRGLIHWAIRLGKAASDYRAHRGTCGIRWLLTYFYSGCADFALDGMLRSFRTKVLVRLPCGLKRFGESFRLVALTRRSAKRGLKLSASITRRRMSSGDVGLGRLTIGRAHAADAFGLMAISHSNQAPKDFNRKLVYQPVGIV